MFQEYEDMVTIDDICSMLNIGKNAAYRLLKEGQLHAFKIGRIWKISKLSVIDYVKGNTKNYI
jgi:excisionase family DNA binding protein